MGAGQRCALTCQCRGILLAGGRRGRIHAVIEEVEEL